MAKTPSYAIDNCGSKYVLRNVNKPTGYLRPDGKLTPFLDGNTLMLNDRQVAEQLMKALNKNHTALIIKMVLETANNQERM